MLEIWANKLLHMALKVCPRSNKSPIWSHWWGLLRVEIDLLKKLPTSAAPVDRQLH